MGQRGYLLLKADLSYLDEKAADEQIWDLIQSIEKIRGIEYVANTVGTYDFVATVDSQETIESVAEDVKNIIPDWIKEVTPLTENNLFKKHRELKDLEILDNMH